jgi:hypothetical protein
LGSSAKPEGKVLEVVQLFVVGKPVTVGGVITPLKTVAVKVDVAVAATDAASFTVSVNTWSVNKVEGEGLVARMVKV